MRLLRKKKVTTEEKKPIPPKKRVRKTEEDPSTKEVIKTYLHELNKDLSPKHLAVFVNYRVRIRENHR